MKLARSLSYIPSIIIAVMVTVTGFAQDDDADEESETENPMVIIDTSKGSIFVELYPDKAPLTVQHFLALVDGDYYDGLIFHRVMKDFVIQTGSFNQELEYQNVEETVKLEADNGLRNEEGTIAMARTEDPDSASSDFYINTSDNSRTLDHVPRDSIAPYRAGYTVFGKVTRGMDIVKKIEAVETETKNLLDQNWRNFPITNVVIISVDRAKAVSSSD